VSAGLSGQPAESSALDGAVVRTLLAVTALAAGLAGAWLARGSVAVLGALAVILAAGNGYGKAYSP
jgi:hypothetical protein